MEPRLLILILVIAVVIVAFVMMSGPAPTEPVTNDVPDVTPIDNPPDNNAPRTYGNVTPGDDVSDSEVDEILGIIKTDADYQDLVDLVGDIDGFELVAIYPLRPWDVADGNEYLNGKLQDYTQYLPYLQELDLNRNTELVRLQRSDGVSLYSVMDREKGQSLQLLLFMKRTLQN
jgi:hypothetical protein